MILCVICTALNDDPWLISNTICYSSHALNMPLSSYPFDTNKTFIFVGVWISHIIMIYIFSDP